jgi:O-antigen/teichoic acid export membrane protein/peptidoglycan/xylan/chitin deacetylase (PgdA/CDA1 family)
MSTLRKSIGLSFIAQYVELLIHFLGVLVLARLLSPSETGTYSVAAVLMTVMHMFRDFGVVHYIIQERELTREKIASTMGVTLMLALAAAAVLAAGSSFAATFYDNPAIRDILLVMSLSFAISPFGSLLIGIFRRNVDFKAILYIRTVSALCHVAVALTLAFRGYGAISLAWANFAGVLSYGIMANLLRPKNLPWLPRFNNVRSILTFGGISSLGNAANTAGTSIPDLVVGKLMSMSAVGYFSRATGLVLLFTRLISGALQPLVLPFFSQIRRDDKPLGAPYLQVVEQITVLAWPFFAVLGLLAYPVIHVLYGYQWDASAPLVPVLCLAGAISSLTMFATHAMVADGGVRSSTMGQLLVQPFRVVAVLIAGYHSLFAVPVALVVSEIFSLLVLSYFLKRTIGVGLLQVLLVNGKSLLVTLSASTVPLLITVYWPEQPGHPWPPLALGALGATLGWLGAIFACKHPFGQHLLAILGAVLPGGADDSTAVRIRLQIKRLAYGAGVLGLVHRLRNRNHLTVAMFHRVLPRDDARNAGADPEWTMSPDTFGHCLTFFKRHYTVVTADQVFAAMRGETSLPPYSLLITFDDGWADTAEYAQPILDRAGLKGLIFVAGSAIDSHAAFWEEQLFSAVVDTSLPHTNLAAALHGAGLSDSASMLPVSRDEAGARRLIAQVGALERPAASALLAQLPTPPYPPAMMTGLQLCKMAQAGHTIGGHGMQHRPLTGVAQVDTELATAQHALAGHLGGRVASMSFPHGAYDCEIVQSCKAAGYRYLFSSDACLMPLADQFAGNAMIGRIHLSERALHHGGRFQAALLGLELFLRPVRRLPVGGPVHG